MLWSPSKNNFTIAENGRFVTYGPDVQAKKLEIETRWPELTCVFDTVDLEWSILEECKDGKTRLALGQTFRKLDDRVIKRLERADDHSRSAPDLEREVDSYNEKRRRDDERDFTEIAGDAAERLTFALRKDGLFDHDDIYGPRPKRGRKFVGAVRHRRERDPS